MFALKYFPKLEAICFRGQSTEMLEQELEEIIMKNQFIKDESYEMVLKVSRKRSNMTIFYRQPPHDGDKFDWISLNNIHEPSIPTLLVCGKFLIYILFINFI